MPAPYLRKLLLATVCSVAAYAADPAPAVPPPTPSEPPKAVTEEQIRARLAEHIKTKNNAKRPAPAAPTPATAEAAAAKTPADSGTASAPTPTPAPAEKEKPTAADLAQTKSEPAAVLPKVEVRRGRPTDIEREVFQQEKDIAREKQKTKSTDVDRALNGAGRSFAIFGGESTKQRETVASERVSLMESERDIMEAIAYAKTKEEKDALRKELAEIKTLRRDLESALR